MRSFVSCKDIITASGPALRFHLVFICCLAIQMHPFPGYGLTADSAKQVRSKEYVTADSSFHQAGKTGANTGKNVFPAKKQTGKSIDEGSAAVSVEKLKEAKSAPCTTAVRMYRELIKNSSTPDSVKAEAYARMAGYYFANENYGRARENYQIATRLSTSPRYRHLWALASAANGDNEAAKSLWHTLSLEQDAETARMAQYCLGMVNMKNELWDEAYNSFLKCGPVTPEHPWSVPALVGKYTCASKLGLTEKTKEYRKQIDQLKGTILEQETLKAIASAPILAAPLADPPAQPAIPANAFTQPTGSKTTGLAQVEQTGTAADTSLKEKTQPATLPEPVSAGFTLQVGAFGSVDNAVKMQKKLGRSFDSVAVFPVTLSDQVFYRVRVGSFDTREQAEEYGKNILVKAGVNYRVVEK